MFLFRSYVKALLGAMRWKTASAIALMVLVSLTEGIGLLLLLPILQLAGLDTLQGNIGVISTSVTSILTFAGLKPALWTVLVIYVVVLGAHALLVRQQTVQNFKLQYDFVYSLREKLYRAIAGSDWLFFSRTRSSDFAHVLIHEADRVGLMTNHFLTLVSNAVLISLYLLIALKVSVSTTLLVLACSLVLLLLLGPQKKSGLETGRGLSTQTGILYATTLEHLGGMKTAKSYGVEERHYEIFSNHTQNTAQTFVAVAKKQAEAKAWFDIGAVILLSVVLYFCIEISHMNTAGLLFLIFLFARIMPKASVVQQNFHVIAHILPAFQNVMEMQQRCIDSVRNVTATQDMKMLEHGIQFENVSFRYYSDGEPVLRDLDVRIPAGEITAMIGPSGAGKSTFADLILGFVSPEQGTIRVDGVPLSPECIQAWRKQIGYVQQDTFLFNDTVRANLLWACPDATEEDLRTALALAAADEFVFALPQGLETPLGDRGVQISGGERQRLALARALLRKPSLLILDEATNAIDSENEMRILETLEALHGKTTILMITHRLSAVRVADSIHFIEQGRLIDSGSWDELISNKEGRFYAFCNFQA